jgi:hypothetical protein
MKKYAFILGVAGMLFAGYMSTVKLLSNTCAFDKPCPYFLGYPACYYGFGIFTAIVLFLILDYWKVIQEKTAEVMVLVISGLGILFAGYFTLKELPILLSRGFGAYFFGLPTCTLGLLFYLFIFGLALVTFLRNKTYNQIVK